MFSATQTRNVDDLARVSLKKTPLYVGVDDHRDTATVEGLEQVSKQIEHVTKFLYDSNLCSSAIVVIDKFVASVYCLVKLS